MIIKLRMVARAAALLFVIGGAGVCFGQQEIIAGGYADASVTDADVVRAAQFAVKKRARAQKAAVRLAAISKARVQVVAGLNYELCLEIDVKRKADKKADRQFARAVVFRSLKNSLSLTNWTSVKDAADCAGAQ
jgi:hypothetical protein